MVFGLFVAGGHPRLFAGTLARATELEQEAARARAEIAALETRLELGRAEVELMRSDPFVEQAGPAAGLGDEGGAALPAARDAPSPPPIVSLGAEATAPAADSPFDAWMTLLFGA